MVFFGPAGRTTGRANVPVVHMRIVPKTHVLSTGAKELRTWKARRRHGMCPVGEKTEWLQIGGRNRRAVATLWARAHASALRSWRVQSVVLTVLPHPHCQVFHNVLKECFMTRQAPRGCPPMDDDALAAPGLIGGRWPGVYPPCRLGSGPTYERVARATKNLGGKNTKKKKTDKKN